MEQIAESNSGLGDGVGTPAEAVLRLGLRPTGGNPSGDGPIILLYDGVSNELNAPEAEPRHPSLCFCKHCSLRVSVPAGWVGKSHF